MLNVILTLVSFMVVFYTDQNGNNYPNSSEPRYPVQVFHGINNDSTVVVATDQQSQSMLIAEPGFVRFIFDCGIYEFQVYEWINATEYVNVPICETTPPVIIQSKIFIPQIYTSEFSTIDERKCTDCAPPRPPQMELLFYTENDNRMGVTAGDIFYFNRQFEALIGENPFLVTTNDQSIAVFPMFLDELRMFLSDCYIVEMQYQNGQQSVQINPHCLFLEHIEDNYD